MWSVLMLSRFRLFFGGEFELNFGGLDKPTSGGPSVGNSEKSRVGTQRSAGEIGGLKDLISASRNYFIIRSPSVVVACALRNKAQGDENCGLRVCQAFTYKVSRFLGLSNPNPGEEGGTVQILEKLEFKG